MSSSQSQGLLGRDPDLSIKRKRLRRWYHVTCQCILYTLFAAFILLLIAIFLAFKLPNKLPNNAFFNFTKTSISLFVHGPHSAMHLDSEIPFEDDEVVKPLFGHETTFDVVATVWVRKDAAREMEQNTNTWNNLQEEVLFNDTIFTGLSLKDKNVRTSVKLRVPTETFKVPTLHTYDLRASFVFIPTFPSLLDHAVWFSSWKNTLAAMGTPYPRMRVYGPESTPSLVEDIVDAYGILTPLLEFHPIESRCGSNASADFPLKDTSANVASNPITDEDSDLEGEISSFDDSPPKNESDNVLFISTEGKSPLEAHPHIIARTFLRAVDMTKLYDRRTYEQIHYGLAMTTCRNDFDLETADWRRCHGSFKDRGNADVLIELGTPIPGDENENTTSWAYGPYISASEGGWGPLDLVPVPVNREECALSHSASATMANTLKHDEEFVDITWNVAFSGRSPWKLFIADSVTSALLTSNMDHLMNGTSVDEERKIRQALVESFQGLAGQRHRDDSHPRRSFLLSFLTNPISIFVSILELHYWATRTKTTGISRSGTIFLLIGYKGLPALRNAWTYYGATGARSIYATLFFLLTTVNLTAIAALLIIFRRSVRWYSWIPVGIEARKATHSERTSDRLDLRVDYKFKIGAFLSLACFFYLSDKFDLAVIQGTNFPEFHDTNPPPMLAILDTGNNLARPACIILGRSLQLLLNFRGKSFAGTYKLCTILSFVNTALLIASISPAIVGVVLISGGVSYFNFAETVLEGVLAYQAALYPRVEQEKDEDEDD